MKMRKLISLILAVILLLPVAIMPVSAASGVPKEVLDARESVVSIGLLLEGVVFPSGTGFAVESNRDETIIVTNRHVVEPCLDDGSIVTPVVYIGSDNYVNGKIIDTSLKDICLISVPTSIDLPKTKIRNESIEVGDPVYAVGFPELSNTGSTRAKIASESTITDGIISTIHDYHNPKYNTTLDCIQHTATFSPGNSGGPLFDAFGNVIGINTWSVSDRDDPGSRVYISIHAKELKAFASQNGIKLTEGKLKEEPAPTVEPTPPPTTKPTPTVAPPVTESPVVESESNGMPGWVWGAIVLVIAVSAVLIVLGIKKQEERRKEEQRRREEEQRQRGQSLFTAPENDKKLIFNDKKTKNESGLIFNDKKKKNHFSSDMDDLS